MSSSMVPTRVSHSRSRYPMRWVSLVSVRSCSPAPTRSVTSASINSWASSRTPSRKKLGSAPCSDLLSRSNSVILRFAIAVVLHVVLEHVTWNHTVAFLSKAFWFYTTTRDATRKGQRAHSGRIRPTDFGHLDVDCYCMNSAPTPDSGGPTQTPLKEAIVQTDNRIIPSEA